MCDVYTLSSVLQSAFMCFWNIEGIRWEFFYRRRHQKFDLEQIQVFHRWRFYFHQRCRGRSEIHVSKKNTKNIRKHSKTSRNTGKEIEKYGMGEPLTLSMDMTASMSSNATKKELSPNTPLFTRTWTFLPLLQFPTTLLPLLPLIITFFLALLPPTTIFIPLLPPKTILIPFLPRKTNFITLLPPITTLPSPLIVFHLHQVTTRKTGETLIYGRKSSRYTKQRVWGR